MQGERGDKPLFLLCNTFTLGASFFVWRSMTRELRSVAIC